MPRSTSRNHRIQPISVTSLLLDDENPRLPERLRGQSQSAILSYLHQRGALEELAQSYVDNGFFQHEPLIVVASNRDGQYVVVEGNRRLAALKILLSTPDVDEFSFVGIEPSKQQLSGLSQVPCFVVSGRDKVHPFVGFRHIGGIKTWPPEAKARYVLTEVRSIARKRPSDPFRELGRRVGSNAQGVRNPYIAIRILLHAREEFGLSVEFIQENRFGVWLRCMNSPDIRQYIGLTNARTYHEIEDALHSLSQDRLAEVLSDLKPHPPARAVLADSRDVTTYGRVLANEDAHKMLRQTSDLSLASQIIDDLNLEARARWLGETVGVFMDALHRAPISDELLEAIEDLFERVRSVRNIVKGRIDDRDIQP